MALRAFHKVVVSDFDALGTVAYKTATETVTSSTVLQNDDQLFLPVTTNARYILDGVLFYTGAASPAGDLKLLFSGPAGATMKWTNRGVNTSALTAYNVVSETLSAGSPRAVGTNGATEMSAFPFGTVTTSSTSGNLQLQWAQNSSSATGTVLAAGSFIRLVRIA
jgi:hypothetical protein